MIPIVKVVTALAANLTNLGHFAVCALLFGVSTRQAGLPNKSRTMILAEASTQTKNTGKLLYHHEISNRSSVQISEHRTAHEILWKHLGEKHRWRRRLLLRLLSTPFRLHSCHDDGDWFLDLFPSIVAFGDPIRSNETSSPEKQKDGGKEFESNESVIRGHEHGCTTSSRS
jgi:hypothetical protein